MSFSRGGFALFALFGAVAIGVLAWYDPPARSSDPRSRVRPHLQPLVEAKGTGLADRALAVLVRAEARRPTQAIRTGIAVLKAELEQFDQSVADHHPESEAVARDHARSLAAEDEIKHRVAEQIPDEELAKLLKRAEADDAISAALEAFFEVRRLDRPLRMEELREEVETYEPADRTAARALHSMRRGVIQDTPEVHALLARAYVAAGRPRAIRRWLLRAYATHPNDETRSALYDHYVANGRLHESFLLLGAMLRAHPDSLELWATRAKVAGWLDRPDAEVEAHEQILSAVDEPERRERLIVLYRSFGEAHRALPHAVAVAESGTTAAEFERPIYLALRSGMVSEALALLVRAAHRDKNDRPWRERIVELALQDYRFGLAVRELKALFEDYEDPRYEKELETLLRRRQNLPELVRLLEARLARHPDDTALEREVLGLHIVLGNDAAIRALTIDQASRVKNPVARLRLLQRYRSLGIEPDPEQLEAFLKLEFTPKDLDEAFAILVNRLEDPFHAKLAVELSRRHRTHPSAQVVRVSLLDRHGTPASRVGGAEALVREHPGDPRFLAVWIDRAAWAGDVEAEIRARQQWLEHDPEDIGNRERLANLLAFVKRPEEALPHWRAVAEARGPRSEATATLIGILFQAGKIEEAIQLVEARANDPEASLEDRRAFADQLFYASHFDRALLFYDAILKEKPEDAQALLRAGQIHSWTSNPRGAVPYLQRRLAVSDEQQGEVQYLLGEALWSIDKPFEARAAHVEAIRLLRDGEPTVLNRTMLAKALVRLGRIREADPLFQELLAAQPDNAELMLDYADALVNTDRLARAQELVRKVRGAEPESVRALRLEGQIHLRQARYEQAAQSYRDALDKQGPDAGIEADLAWALEKSGEWSQAAEAYGRSLLLQPGNRDLARNRASLLDRVSRRFTGDAVYRFAGTDKAFELDSDVQLPLHGDRTFLRAGVGLGIYDGQAAVAAGSRVTETLFTLRAALHHRFQRTNEVAVGVDAYVGGSRDVPVAGWVSLKLLGEEPFSSFSVRGYSNVLLRNPVAAAGLDGTADGVRAEYLRDLGGPWWGGVTLGIESLSIRPPGGSRVRDGRFEGSLSVGRRLTNGFGARVTYHGIRLLGDKQLSTLIPIGQTFDYLTGAVTWQKVVAQKLKADAEAYAGLDAAGGDFLWGLSASVEWRAAERLMLRAGFNLGFSLGRNDGDSVAGSFRLGLTYRW